MEYVTVGELDLPKLGFGTSQNTGRTCVDAVQTALDVGYRHIDTAQVYGNEREVGKGIAASTVDREEVFVTTKINRGNLRHDDVLESVRESLKRLGTTYIDLLLIHWPHLRVPVEETLDAMATLQNDGLVRHLGISNFTRSQLAEARSVTDRSLAVNQVLYHPYKDQTELLEYCRGHDIVLTAYSPLARGGVVGDEELARIGDRYEKSAVQVALRWLLQQEQVIAIPKATSRDHIESNFDVFDFTLTESEMHTIDELDPGLTRRVMNIAPALMRHNPL